MDEEGIGLVLARASELRAKIINCIHKASTLQIDRNASKEEKEIEATNALSGSRVEFGEAGQEQEEEAEETESLLNIRDALQSLEAQVSSLQALQQQQWYEREAALAEIEHSRKKLLMKLKEYKGEDLEVIKETTAFASETVEDNNDLLLPPYPTRPSRSIVSDNGYPSHFHSTHKFSQNGLVSGDPAYELKKNINDLDRNPEQSQSKSSGKGVRAFVGAAAKTIITLVGIVSVLRLAGFNPRFRKMDSQFRVLGPFQQQGDEEKRATILCPPGKVPVVENGESRCIVKERVEIPFESVVATPDVNYGCG